MKLLARLRAIRRPPEAPPGPGRGELAAERAMRDARLVLAQAARAVRDVETGNVVRDSLTGSRRVEGEGGR